MYKRIIQCFFFGIAILFSGGSFGQTTLSLEECVEIALKNNPDLHRAELQYEREKIDQRQAWQNALPTIEGDAGHSWSQGRSIDPTTNQFIEQTISSGNASISAGMYLFKGFEIIHDIRQKAAAEKAGNMGYEAQKEALILDVMEAYITVLTARDLLEQAQNQLALAQEQFDQSETLQAEGDIDPGDYYDLKGEYNENKNNVALARQDLFHSRVTLAGFLHLSEEELPELQGLLLKEEQTDTSASALFETGKQRPFYALWDWRVKEAEQAVKVAQAAYYPSLSISAGMDTRYSNSSDLSFWDQNKNNFGKYISFNINIPIFNGFRIRNTVKNAKIDLKDVEWQKKATENELREATSNAVFDLESSRKMVKNLVEQEEHYRESFRIAQVKFDLGASNSVLYLTAKNKWENSKNQLVVKQYEWIFQQYINDYYSGVLPF